MLHCTLAWFLDKYNKICRILRNHVEAWQADLKITECAIKFYKPKLE